LRQEARGKGQGTRDKGEWLDTKVGRIRPWPPSDMADTVRLNLGMRSDYCELLQYSGLSGMKTWMHYMENNGNNQTPTQEAIYEVIFGYESRAGKVFDLVLILAIFASVLAVMLDSVPSINIVYHPQLYFLEWIFTLLFTVEYGLRLYSSKSTKGYAFSFYGLIDLFSILPTYIAFSGRAVST